MELLELDSQTITSFCLGLLAGVLIFSLVIPTIRKRSRAVYRNQIEDYEQTVVDLRQERADDRETNRRLRRELAISTPEHLEVTRQELGSANEHVSRLSDELRQSHGELTERDRSLREARLAIQEIRLQLEQDRLEPDAQDEQISDDDVVLLSNKGPSALDDLLAEVLDDVPVDGDGGPVDGLADVLLVDGDDVAVDVLDEVDEVDDLDEVDGDTSAPAVTNGDSEIADGDLDFGAGAGPETDPSECSGSPDEAGDAARDIDGADHGSTDGQDGQDSGDDSTLLVGEVSAGDASTA